MIIDFHSHILPGIDDGSRSVADSLEMLQMEAAQGIKQVIATPHFYPQHDSPERFLRRRKAAEEVLREEVKKHPGLPDISVGAELYFFHGISDSDIISELTIAGKGCILLEMPESPWSDSMYREIANISRNFGITPIIAHVERYFQPFRTNQMLDKLAKLPVLIQSNANFFLRNNTRRMALRMLQEGKIHLLGSDCHNLSSRAPNLGDAIHVIEHHLGSGAIKWIESNQNLILADE